LAYQPPANSTFISEQTSHQPAVLFSQNKPAPAISHQPNEQAESFFSAEPSADFINLKYLTSLSFS
jgi:hypothetical protein